MSDTINIGGDPNDRNYRYKRNRIALEKISKNGGMMRIKNFDLICSQLKVNKNHFKEAYYKQLKKKGIKVRDDGFFKGEIRIPDLEEILNRMIAKYLLCPVCGLPELSGTHCRACGHNGGETKEVDKTHADKTHLKEEGKPWDIAPPEENPISANSKVVEWAKKLYDIHTPEAHTYLDIFWMIEDYENEPNRQKWVEIVEQVFQQGKELPQRYKTLQAVKNLYDRFFPNGMSYGGLNS